MPGIPSHQSEAATYTIRHMYAP